jgi:hypothetical protein
MTKTPATQLDREIAESLSRPLGSRAADGRQPLYGHTSEATAYLVDDYPYGGLRTQIRYWLEHKTGKGWRFVSQTRNPKTDRWNKPKPSTYLEWAGAMYLDDNGHVHWDGVGPYTDASKFLAFVQTFPGADLSMIRKVVPAKIRLAQDLISGAKVFTINGGAGDLGDGQARSLNLTSRSTSPTLSGERDRSYDPLKSLHADPLRGADASSAHVRGHRRTTELRPVGARRANPPSRQERWLDQLRGQARASSTHPPRLPSR